MERVNRVKVVVREVPHPMEMAKVNPAEKAEKKGAKEKENLPMEKERAKVKARAKTVMLTKKVKRVQIQFPMI